jgi:hypothetical protein
MRARGDSLRTTDACVNHLVLSNGRILPQTGAGMHEPCGASAAAGPASARLPAEAERGAPRRLFHASRHRSNP